MPAASECANNEVLKWDAVGDRWLCGTDNSSGLSTNAVNSAHILDSTIKQVDIDATSVGLWDVNGSDTSRSSGKVGIGLTNPNEPLTVVGAISLKAAAAPTASTGFGKIYVKNTDGRLYYKNELGVERDLTSNTISDPSSLSLIADNDSNGTGDFIFSTAGSPKLFISNSGNVGIGTINPLDLLHISSATGVATATISGADSSQSVINFMTKSDGNGLGTTGANRGFQLSSFGNTYGTTSNKNDFAISYWDGSSFEDRLHIDANGFLGISNNNPAYTLDVGGNGRFAGTLKVENLAVATATQLCINGNVLANCSSSIRYKENVRDLLPALDTILSLRPVTYDWKESHIHDLGFIAEEVEKIDPNLVTYNKDNQIQGVKYDQITAPLVKAFQQLYEMLMGTRDDVDSLKRELAAVKAENAAIKAENEQTKARLDRIEQQLQSK
jgi:hypothetical protein